jgi:hypothetical protein
MMMTDTGGEVEYKVIFGVHIYNLERTLNQYVNQGWQVYVTNYREELDTYNIVFVRSK